MRKFALILMTTMVIFISRFYGQSYPGYRTGSYTGVNGVFFNPANIADNGYKWSMNLFSINGFIGTDQGGLKFSDITRSFNSDSLKSKLLRGNTQINSLNYVDILGPSFMITLSPRTSVAFTTATKVFSNIRDLNGDLANAMINASNSGLTEPVSLTGNNSVVHATGWTEVGASIAHVFSNEQSHHFYKGGITVKWLAGNADSYLQADGLTGTLENINGVANISGPASGYISINSTNTDFKNYRMSDFFNFSGNGIGADIGLVYEYRPDLNYTDYTDDRWANKYTWKVGVSLLNLGSIHFNKSSNTVANYQADIPAGQSLNLDKFYNKTINEFVKIFNESPYFTAGTPQSSSYKVSLPTTLQFNVDHLINARWGVNLAAQVNMNNQKNFNLYYFNSYSLTPRWENPTFSVELPLNYNELTEFNAGLALRAGPFFIGSGSVISALFKNSKQADLFLGFTWGLQFKKIRRPDMDNDGINDHEDNCPDVPGVARYRGCPIPDTDRDGINDELDSCLSEPGYARYKGCPIPDTDHDGVNDEEDSCVQIPGVARFHGCPDADGDGVPDSQDKCPIVFGTAKYNGCPAPDTDGDGIKDEADSCKTVKGPASTHGCPVDQVASQISSEFKNILFNGGKASIRSESIKIIIRAADIMNEQVPNARFYVDGYTDNVGKPAVNKKLSQARAQSVVNALADYGVKKDRLTARGFGDENPICPNTTEEGRQCNRRVEVVIRNNP